jgi:exo-beta-1,3-glucanase (GH17 family)
LHGTASVCSIDDQGHLQHASIVLPSFVPEIARQWRGRSFAGTRAGSYHLPFILLLLSFGVIVVTWSFLAAPIPSSELSGGLARKLDCISYAPYRGAQNPLTPGLIVREQEIAQDLVQLARISNCVRTYSTGNGMDKTVKLAQSVGLKSFLGIWIGTNPTENLQQIETAIALANQYPETVGAIVVGNEVMLRGEMTVEALANIIRSVKARVRVPVTYADVWEFWLRSPALSDAVDFITIHVLPFWEDVPVKAELAAAHLDSVRRQVAAAFPGKEILIGEVGWPSAGRMREGALPSRANQVRVISDVLALARAQNFRVNLIEAYDQPWKRKWEGTVGGHWGLFDSDQRAMKYPTGEPVRNHPFWRLQLGCGLAFCLAIFATAFLALRGQFGQLRPASWCAVALFATVGGALVGLLIEHVVLESLSTGDWVRRVALLATAISAPLLSTLALISGQTPPAFSDLMSPRDGKKRAGLEPALGVTLLATSLIGGVTALGLVFDPRYRDFPFIALTMSVLPLLVLRTIHRARATEQPIAEWVFAGLFGLSTLYIGFHEGPNNWHSLWTCCAYFLLGVTLLQTRVTASGPKSVIQASETVHDRGVSPATGNSKPQRSRDRLLQDATE